MQGHTKGLLIAFTGVLVLSPDTLVIRLIDMQSWPFIYWRSLFSMLFFVLLALIFQGKDLMSTIKSFSQQNLFVCLMYALSSICFVFSVSLTSVVNTLIIFNTSPLFSALLSRVFLKETIDYKTILSIFIVFFCVMFIVSDSYFIGNYWGDLYALASAFFLSCAFVGSRHSKNRHTFFILLLSNLIVALVALVFSGGINHVNNISEQQFWLCILDGFIVAIAFAFISSAPRYIAATEVSLMMTLEVVLGGFLVWFFLGESSSFLTLLASIIILLTIGIHSYLATPKMALRKRL